MIFTGVRFVEEPLVFPIFDSFFFFRASKTKMEAMRGILAQYEIESGQATNCQKSGILFTKNVPQLERDKTSHALGVATPLNTGRYLGLLYLIGRSKRQVFGYL